MFWIIFFIFLIFTLLWINKKDPTWGIEKIIGTVIVSIILIFFTISIFALNGLTDLPQLLKKKETVKVYKHNLDLIKNATYKNTVSNNALINGNVENIKQSTNLSEYIKQMTNLQAEYNSSLIKCKFYINSTLWWWFGDGIFMSNEILKLSPIN